MRLCHSFASLITWVVIMAMFSSSTTQSEDRALGSEKEEEHDRPEFDATRSSPEKEEELTSLDDHPGVFLLGTEETHTRPEGHATGSSPTRSSPEKEESSPRPEVHAEELITENEERPTQRQDLTSAAKTGKKEGRTLPGLRFVCCSDTHGFHNSGRLTLPAGDVLLYCGDAGLEDQHDVKQFEVWLASQTFAHKVVVMGNMDRAAAIPPNRGRGGIHAKQSCIQLNSGKVIYDEIFEVAGYKILGSPWTPAFYGQWQLENEAAAHRHWRGLLQPDTRVDIIMTHGPPYGFGDVTQGRHVGDRALLEAVKDLKIPPLLWICGHIHASCGEHRVPHPVVPEGILLINAAANNLRDGECNAAPRAVDLPEGIVHLESQDQARRGLNSTEGEVWKDDVEMTF